jgi:hypothetical protein
MTSFSLPYLNTRPKKPWAIEAWSAFWSANAMGSSPASLARSRSSSVLASMIVNSNLPFDLVWYSLRRSFRSRTNTLRRAIPLVVGTKASTLMGSLRLLTSLPLPSLKVYRWELVSSQRTVDFATSQLMATAMAAKTTK